MNDGMMTEQWLRGREWSGQVWLDGEDVSSSCFEVLMQGERPVAVKLGVRVHGRLIRRPRCDGALTEIRQGAIRLVGVRRRTAEEQQWLAWSRRW
jgi:hypothetical protein